MQANFQRYYLAPMVSALLVPAGAILIGTTSARAANEIFYAPPVIGDGKVTTLDGDGPYIQKVDIQIPGGFVKDTWPSEPESYHFNLDGTAGAGVFRISYTMWLTNDGVEIPNTRGEWMSGLIGPAEWGSGSLASSIPIELTDGTRNFNDIHGEFFITSQQPSTLAWNRITLGINADAANVPGPLPILGLTAAFGFSRKLRNRIKLHQGTSAISTSPGA